MLEKVTDAVSVLAVIGQDCIEFAAPPIVPTPAPVPAPPVPGTDPPAPPVPSSPVGNIASIDTYQDTLGNCWKLITYSTAPSFGSTMERTPIDCAEL